MYGYDRKYFKPVLADDQHQRRSSSRPFFQSISKIWYTIVHFISKLPIIQDFQTVRNAFSNLLISLLMAYQQNNLKSRYSLQLSSAALSIMPTLQKYSIVNASLRMKRTGQSGCQNQLYYLLFLIRLR